MSGIKEILTLIYWVDNDKGPYLEESFRPCRPRSKERDAIKESLKKTRSSIEKRGKSPPNN